MRGPGRTHEQDLRRPPASRSATESDGKRRNARSRRSIRSICRSDPASPSHARDDAQPLLEQAAAVTRFGAELHRRMGEAGLDGVQGLFALADQLQRALATVSQPELDTAEADLERVADQVRAMKDNLRQLKAVKADLEGSRR